MMAIKILWGIGLILAAVFIVLDAIGVIAPIVGFMGEISVFAALGVIALVAIIISLCIKKKPLQIFFPLAFIFMLLEKNTKKVR